MHFQKRHVFLAFLSISCIYVQGQQNFTAGRLDTSIVKSKHVWHKSFLKNTSFGVGYTGLCLLTYKFIDPDLQEDTQERLTPFEEKSAKFISPLGLGKVNWIGCGAVAVTGYIAKNKQLKKLSAVWAGGLIINDFFTNQLKEGFQRHRPTNGDRFNVFDGPQGPKVNKSMPSAHTSNAFTTATAFATVYKNKKWVAPVAYGMAAFVGVSRIYNNAHWASDVMVGAGVGYLSTKLSFFLFKQIMKAEHKYQERKTHIGSVL